MIRWFAITLGKSKVVNFSKLLLMLPIALYKYVLERIAEYKIQLKALIFQHFCQNKLYPPLRLDLLCYPLNQNICAFKIL